MVVMNNGWGISTPACSQHGEQHIIDRGKAFGIPGEVVDGNDPIASWHAIRRAMDYCRARAAAVSCWRRWCRGCTAIRRRAAALRVKNEPDCIALFEQKLLEAGAIDRETIERTHEEATAEAEAALEQALREPKPMPADVEKFTYADSQVDAVYPGDYTGLP